MWFLKNRNKPWSKSPSWAVCGLFATHGLQCAGLPCPWLSPGACSHSCSLSQWCYPIISSSAVPFSSCLQSLPASGSFPMSQFFSSGGQNIGTSASVLLMHIQGWCPLGLTGLTPCNPKGLSRVFSSTSVPISQFNPSPSHFLAFLFLLSPPLQNNVICLQCVI